MKYSFTGTTNHIDGGVTALLSREFDSHSAAAEGAKSRYNLNQHQLDILKAGGKVIKRNTEITVNPIQKG